MTSLSGPLHGPRQTLFVIGRLFCGFAIGLAILWFVDLRDGRTYTQERRGGPWMLVSMEDNKESFVIAITMRYAVPVVLLGTIGLVSILGGFAQRRAETSK
jgi:hypothetical protein